MVCDKCKVKLKEVITPDPYRNKAKKQTKNDRKLNENKLLSSRKFNFTTRSKVYCKKCKGVIHQPHAFYCQNCCYKFGICAMCGIKIKDVTATRQADV